MFSMKVCHDETLSASEGKPYLPKLCNSSQFRAGVLCEGVEEEQVRALGQDIYRNLLGLSTTCHYSSA